jgi:hypothetical protein
MKTLEIPATTDALRQRATTALADQFDSNGDCRLCGYHASEPYHRYLQGKVVCSNHRKTARPIKVYRVEVRPMAGGSSATCEVCRDKGLPVGMHSASTGGVSLSLPQTLSRDGAATTACSMNHAMDAALSLVRYYTRAKTYRIELIEARLIRTETVVATSDMISDKVGG